MSVHHMKYVNMGFVPNCDLNNILLEEVKEIKDLGVCLDSLLVFTARRYAKRGICHRRVSVCLCVCVFLSHSGIVSKRLNVGSCK